MFNDSDYVFVVFYSVVLNVMYLEKVRVMYVNEYLYESYKRLRYFF